MSTIMVNNQTTINKKILPIVRKVIEEDIIFQQLDQGEMVKLIVNLIEQYLTPETINNLSNEILTQRIRKILTIEVMSHLLDDLTPEQIKMFDQAVARI